MSYMRIEPKSYRAKLEIVRIGELLPEAVESVKAYGRISPMEMGMDWNSCVLEKTRGKGLVFTISGENGCSGITLDGLVKNFGRNEIGVQIDTRASGQSFHRNYVLGSLYESMNIASKLEIIENEILPGGEIIEPVVRSHGGGRTSGQGDIDSYRAFASELLSRARKVIVSKPNNDFGDYIVAETNHGWFIAYNVDYGSGLYIVENFDTLLLDKQTIRREGSAITMRRDRRGNWKSRVMEFI